MNAPSPPIPEYVTALLDGLKPAAVRRSDALRTLAVVHAARVALDAYAWDVVAAAREGGATWREVGIATGMPVQNAHRKYHDVSKRPTVEGTS